MAVKVFTDARIYGERQDLSGKSNQVAFMINPTEVAKTTFGNLGKRRLAGLPDGSISIAGLIDYESGAGSMDDRLWNNLLGVNDLPWTVADPATHGSLVEGDPASFGRGVLLDFTPFQAPVGDAHNFDAEVKLSKHMIAGGTILHEDTARTSTGTSTGLQRAGGVAAGQKLYAALHVLAASGSSPTLDVVVQSDNGSGFPSPTGQITFAQATGVGAEWGTPVAGAIADDWYRVSYTIGGGSPSFTFIVVLGIQ